MPKFRSVPTIYMKTTAKGDCNVTIDLNELKKEPDWVTDKKDTQNIRQFFVRRGDNPSLYEVWDEDDPDIPQREEKKDVPF